MRGERGDTPNCPPINVPAELRGERGDRGEPGLTGTETLLLIVKFQQFIYVLLLVLLNTASLKLLWGAKRLKHFS